MCYCNRGHQLNMFVKMFSISPRHFDAARLYTFEIFKENIKIILCNFIITFITFRRIFLYITSIVKLISHCFYLINVVVIEVLLGRSIYLFNCAVIFTWFSFSSIIARWHEQIIRWKMMWRKIGNYNLGQASQGNALLIKI